MKEVLIFDQFANFLQQFLEDQKVGIDDSLECSFGGLFGGIFDTRGSKKIDTKSKDTKNNIRQDPETTTPRRDSTTGETDKNDIRI